MVNPTFNHQNDQWIHFSEDKDGGGGNLNGPIGKYILRSKHLAGAVMLGAVANTGERSPPIWVPEGFRLGAEAYIEILRDTLILWMQRVAVSRGLLSGPAPFFYQQDSAPAHWAKKTLDFFKQ